MVAVTGKEVDRELGRRVAAARTYAGLSQEDLGTRTGADRSAIDRLENNRHKKPLTETARRDWIERVVEATNAPLQLFDGFDLGESGISRLSRDVARLHREVRELGEILGQVPAAKGEALTRLLGRLDATNPTPLEKPDEGQGQ